MKKFIKAVVIGYAVLWGVDEIKARRPLREENNPNKRIPPKRRFKSMTSN